MMIGCHAEAISRDITIDRDRTGRCALVSAARNGRHADAHASAGLITPPPSAIAHHIIRAWVEDGARVLD
jgi:NAD+ diphosphatase